ncbi:hypothetical protein BH10ACT1_BH10ACT1_04600 [soil metagenome]
MVEREWRIDAGLARDLAAALGWSGDRGPAALAELLPQRVPTGSTAKLASMAAGEVPPGDDPEALARQLLEHLEVRAARSPGGAPSPSWSCWVVSTVMAALVDHAELGPVRVVATRRIDEGAPLVDLHAEVVVVVDGETWVCDPYFGVGLVAPTGAGVAGEVHVGPCAAWLQHDGEHGWALAVRLDHWRAPLRYRVLGPSLDRGDVRAMAEISTTHTGVPARPYARLHLDGDAVDVFADDSGHGRFVRHPHQPPAEGDPPMGETLPTWEDAVEAFAAHTGTRIT